MKSAHTGEGEGRIAEVAVESTEDVRGQPCEARKKGDCVGGKSPESIGIGKTFISWYPNLISTNIIGLFI